MDRPQKYDLPTSDIEDKAHVIVRSILSSVPVVGGAAVELFAALVTPPLERRRQAWMETIAEGLRELEERRGIGLEELQSNDQFITILIQASQMAVRNHQHEKLHALRAAVLNSAIKIDTTSELDELFIRYIDELTPSHLSLLKFLSDQEQTLTNIESYERLFEVFRSYNSGSVIDRDEFKLLCNDLISRLLLRISDSVEDFSDIRHNNIVVMNGSNADAPKLRLTSVGKKFLTSITSQV